MREPMLGHERAASNNGERHVVEETALYVRRQSVRRTAKLDTHTRVCLTDQYSHDHISTGYRKSKLVGPSFENADH